MAPIASDEQLVRHRSVLPGLSLAAAAAILRLVIARPEYFPTPEPLPTRAHLTKLPLPDIIAWPFGNQTLATDYSLIRIVTATPPNLRLVP